MEFRNPHEDPYSAFTQKLEDFQKQGYTTEFKVVDETTLRDDDENTYAPQDLTLNDIYRYTGSKNWFTTKDHTEAPKAIFALSAKNGVKGYVIDGYGEDSDEVVEQFLRNVDRFDELNGNYTS